MAVVTLTATTRGPDAVIGQGLSGTVKCVPSTVTVGSSDSDTSYYTMCQIPSNARILGISRLFTDDLASTGSPTLDIGLFPVNGNITGDVDALNDGIDAASVTDVRVIKDLANYGKRAWEFVNGQATDPGGVLEVRVTLDDANVNVGGDMSMELYYTID